MCGYCFPIATGGSRARARQSIAPGTGVPEHEERAGGRR